ncbi:hypothetical protein MNBD_BACTEROID01-187 [hydrothermal vent metagenome]|uniref:Uncharacterized protein n=1 Tax=hydrothermal vent metagenome TaxID=652676 RepID=A0A3B0TKU5_9ZZZZ
MLKTFAFMINYTSQNQLSLELFKHPFEQELDKAKRIWSEQHKNPVTRDI